jgi:rubredoxin-NAD+ reductase
MLFVAPLLTCARALAKTLAGEDTLVDYPAMPVILKTPVCPIAVIPPPENTEGEWTVLGDGANLQALFHDMQQQLRGFALSGSCVKEKAVLAKQLPRVFVSDFRPNGRVAEEKSIKT